MKKYKLFLTVIIVSAAFLFSSGIIYINTDNNPPESTKNNYENYKENENDTFYLRDKRDINKTSSISWEEKKYQNHESTAFNVLLLGGDKVYNNTDSIVLVNFNPSSYKISMMSIPRDTKVNIDGRSRKINFAFPKGGGKLALETVEKLLDTKIEHYVFIDTKAFRDVIDLLGGVEFYVPRNMNYEDPSQGLFIHLKKGFQVLDGKEAEQLVRYRAGYNDGDISRIKVQQDFIKAVIEQKLDIKYLSKIKRIIETIFDSVDTDISIADALKMTSYLGKIDSENINSMTLPGYVSEKSPAWYFIYNNTKTKALIEKYFTTN